VCIHANILISDDSDKGQAEISSGVTNTDCVNNHHGHKQQMCQWMMIIFWRVSCLSCLTHKLEAKSKTEGQRKIKGKFFMQNMKVLVHVFFYREWGLKC